MSSFQKSDTFLGLKTPFILGFNISATCSLTMVTQVLISPLTAYIHPDLHNGLLSVRNSTDINMHPLFTGVWACMDVLTQVHAPFSRLL